METSVHPHKQNAHLPNFAAVCLPVLWAVLCELQAVILLTWRWKRSRNNSLLWRESPYLLLLSQCLWGLAAAHWRSYMTVKRAINAGGEREREAEVYGCLCSAIVRPCLAHPLLHARWNSVPNYGTSSPCCRSNAAIKAVWESGAFVQLECWCNKPSETQGY